MSKLTLDEAIKHCLDIADGQDKCAEISVSEHAKERISQCAADHRQLAEWLTELRATRYYINRICEELAELYGSPCNYSPQDEYMLENGSCEDCCGNIPDKDCWARYFHRKLNKQTNAAGELVEKITQKIGRDGL